VFIYNIYNKKKFVIYQIQDPDTKSLAYIISDKKNSTAVILDPVEDMVDYYIKFASKKNFELNFTIDTHIHADHISGSNKLVYLNKNCKYFMGSAGETKKITNNLITDSSTFNIGDIKLKAFHTPGHTKESFCYFLSPYLFTGDTVLINSTGRTDLADGSPEMMYKSIFSNLINLDKKTIILPGHDYKGKFRSTLSEQMLDNPYLAAKDKASFINLKKQQKLSDPEKICISTKRNMQPIALYKAFVQTC